ncbi:MAG: hypothetical protein HUJ76_11160 [Parasporobacterium sp.]|nr:hypothetical protein [Parasporobacterium sp.]
MNQELPPIAVRSMRNMAAVSCSDPDRVPFAPSMNNFYAYHYGVTTQEMMTDPASLMEPLRRYREDYDPDWIWNPIPFPIKPMETIGHNQARWPGEYWNLPENTPYQYVDHSYMSEDDYEEYFRDPTLYILQKVLPNKFKNLGGLRFINPYAMCGHAILSYAQFGNPAVADALKTLMQTGIENIEFLQKAVPLVMSCVEAGYPVYGLAPACVPFDDFADNVRGLMELCMDIVTDPEKVDEALEKWGEVSIPAAIANAKMNHAEDLFMPLHCGVDNFMSLENYEKHYWPTFKKMMLAAIDAGLTPIVFCEGRYDTRLECISDIPKGKVIYTFENVNLKEAKRILGGTACIAGGVDTHVLMNGTPADVERNVRESLDILAPGGGYISMNTIALDHVSPENMHAWRDTIEKYGKY